METTNKKFRCEFAINLQSAPVPQTNHNMRIFPLQNALIDVTHGEEHAKPAWYSHFSVGDEISFRLVDITNLRAPEIEPEYPSFALAEFYFKGPELGQTVNPFTENIQAWRFSDRRADQPSPAFSLKEGHALPTWDLIAHTAVGRELDTVHLAGFEAVTEERAFRAFELTVAIKLMEGGWMNHYVFDPEIIVSETDNEGDQGGGGKGGKR